MKKHLIFLSLIFSVGLAGAANGAVVGTLKCENLVAPLAIDTAVPHFSWALTDAAAGEGQRFYRIQVSSDPLFAECDLWDSGKVRSADQVMVPYGGVALASRDLCYWRVMVWTGRGASEWSETARFGVGLLDDACVEGGFIGSRGSGSVAVLLRKKFEVKEAGGVELLHVNSLGYHEVWLNGERVGEDVLSPAISQMNKRPLWVTYDVSGKVRRGGNEIVVWLGQGWYKKNTFGRWEDDSYAEPLVRAQLDVLSGDGGGRGGWKTLCATDGSWSSRLSGYTDTGSWNALSFGGERVDARLNPADMRSKTLDALEWSEVVEVEKPQYKASPQMCEPNRIRRTFSPVEIRQAADGAWIVDMGEVVTGWFEMAMEDLPQGHTVTMEYSDEVDDKGELLDQRQNDTYIARGGGREVFVNKFNHHAFRWVKIHGLAVRPPERNLKAHLIHTDYAEAASFECSDGDLNAIHDMIFRTMTRLAYSGYMVDCPHLERAGYGGDGNSSTETLQTMYDTAPLFANWVQSWADAMRPGGSLPHVAPNAGAGGGGPYWCGFMVQAPWQTWWNYNDTRLVERHYDAMQQWLGYVDEYTTDGLLGRWPDTPYRDWYLGDWLAPQGVDSGNQESIVLVNNCFVSDCLAKMADMATLLGRDADAVIYTRKRNALNTLIHEKFFKQADNTYATGSQLDMTYPMLVGVTPAELRDDVEAALFALTVSRMDGHIGGGLVGVPIITKWAIENRAADWIYTMLKKRDYPGYLYMIDHGATTTWEYWNGERSRVHNCYNGIGMWFYEAVGGLRPSEPGYRSVVIDPQIPAGVTWSKMTKQTPYGEIAVDWTLGAQALDLKVSLPSGTSASVVAPSGAGKCSVNGRARQIKNGAVPLGSGTQHVVFTLKK
jgi:alpha-L-rhamnosidase